MLLSKNKALAKILLEHGLITEKQLKKARKLKKTKRRSLDKTLVGMGIIAKKQLKGLRQAVLYYLIRQADKFYGKIAAQSQIVEERYVREALEEQKRLHLEEKRLVRLSKLLISSHNITPKADKAIQEALHKMVVEAKEARRKSQKTVIARATKGLRRGRGLVDSTDAQSGDLEAVTREKLKKTRLSRSDDALADVELIDSDSEIEVEDALESVEELEELEGIEELSEDMFEDADGSGEEVIDASDDEEFVEDSDEEVLNDSDEAGDLLEESDAVVAGPPPLADADALDELDELDDLDELDGSDEPELIESDAAVLDESDAEVFEDSDAGEEDQPTEINEHPEQSDLPAEADEVVDLDALSDPELDTALEDSDEVEDIEPADSVEEVLANLSDDEPDELKDLEQIEDDSEVSDLDEIESEAELDQESEEELEESEEVVAEAEAEKPNRKRIPKPRKAPQKKKSSGKEKPVSGKMAKFLSGRTKSSFKKPLVAPKRRPRKR